MGGLKLPAPYPEHRQAPVFSGQILPHGKSSAQQLPHPGYFLRQLVMLFPQFLKRVLLWHIIWYMVDN